MSLTKGTASQRASQLIQLGSAQAKSDGHIPDLREFVSEAIEITGDKSLERYMPPDNFSDYDTDSKTGFELGAISAVQKSIVNWSASSRNLAKAARINQDAADRIDRQKAEQEKWEAEQKRLEEERKKKEEEEKEPEKPKDEKEETEETKEKEPDAPSPNKDLKQSEIVKKEDYLEANQDKISKANYHEILGVDKNASEDEIRQAFRKLSKANKHPNILEGELRAKGLTTEEIEPLLKDASENFVALNTAYEALIKAKREGRNTPHAKAPQIEDTRPEYYKALGVQKDASYDEILKAYQEAMKDPSRSSSEKDELGKMLFILSDKDARAIYDKGEEIKLLKTQRPDAPPPSSKVSKKTPDGPTPKIKLDIPPLVKDSTWKLIIAFTPTIDENDEIRNAQKNTEDFRNGVLAAGPLDFNKKEIERLKKLGYIPKNFSDAQANAVMNTAHRVIASGGTASELLKASQNSKDLDSSQKSFFETVALNVGALQASNPTLTKNIHLASGEPAIEIKSVPPSQIYSNKYQQIVMDFANNVLVPTFEKFTAYGVQKAKAFLIKSLESKAAKQFVAFAAKLGLKAAIQTLGQFAGSILPGIGHAIMAFVGWVAGEVIERVFGAVKNFIEKNKDIFMGAGMILLGLGALLGNGVFLGLGTGLVLLPLLAGGVAMVTSGAAAAATVTIMFIAATYPVWAVALWMVIGVIVLVILTIFTLLIINSGGYVVPVWYGSAFAPGVENPYINVTKEAEPNEVSNPPPSKTITYTVTIEAKLETLTNVSMVNYTCKVIKKDKTAVNCPPNNVPEFPEGVTVNVGTPYTFSYTVSYGDQFKDSLIVDSIEISAERTTGSTVNSAASASVCVGDCPEDCPSIWPVAAGDLTQGPLTNSSHSGIQAIDVSVSSVPVYATHGGVVEHVDSSCEGNVIMIKSTCDGVEFRSRYSHLASRSVGPGAIVSTGQTIGVSDNTGTCTTGAHLHYEFKGLPMAVPWIPKAIQPVSNCCTNCGPSSLSCTTTIP